MRVVACAVAGAMLTSEDLPETYRNVQSEGAEDGCTAGSAHA